MGHSYANILIHAVFSTKDRHPWLSTEIRDEIFRYLGGTVNELGGQSLLVNGPADHVHMLFVQPRTLSIPTLMERSRPIPPGGSRNGGRTTPVFGWQTGYAAFSVSKSHLEAARRYIRNQEEHHRRISFQEELLSFLDRQGIMFDPRYVFT
jgi:putative transposase